MDLSTRYDDWRTSTTIERDRCTVIAPHLLWQGGTERLDLRLSGRHNFTMGSKLDPGSTQASLQISTGVPERRVTLGGTLTHSPDGYEVEEPSVFDRRRETSWRAWSSASLGFAEGAFRVRGWSYDTLATRHAANIAWSVSVLPFRSRHDAWLVGWRQHQLMHGPARYYTAHAAVVGYRRELQPHVVGQIEAGYGELIHGDGTIDREPAFSLEIRRPTGGDGSSTRFRWGEDPLTSLEAEYTRPIRDGRVALRWERRADLSGELHDDVMMARRWVLGIEDTLARSNVLGLESSLVQTRPFRVPGEPSDAVRVSGWLIRRVRPWLSARIAYSQSRPIGSITLERSTLRRQRVEAGITARFP